jgi:glycosyltransferase involved in cell wall biosynthesis
MLHNIFLSFQHQSMVKTNQQLFTNIKNTFTIEFWAKPEAPHGIGKESVIGISNDINVARFAVTPVLGSYLDGDASRAGIGVSVGTNGVSVYEHTTNHLPSVLVFSMFLEGWTHISVVYNNKIPTLYINGRYAKTGLRSQKKTVVPSGVFGGLMPNDFFWGALKDIRIWNTARTQSEIQTYMNKELEGTEDGLFGLWKLNEKSGNIANDSTKNNNTGTIVGGKWNTIKTEDVSGNIKEKKGHVTNQSDSLIENNQIIEGDIMNSIKKVSSLNKKMNILFTFFVPSGGVETLNRQRFHALSQTGITCHFLYTQPGTGLQNKIDTSIFITNQDNEIEEIIQKGNYKAIVVGSDLVMLQKLRNMGYKGLLIYEIQGLGFNKEYAETFLKNHALPIIDRYCDAILYPQTPHLMKAFETYFPLKNKFCFHNCFNTQEFKYQVFPKRQKPIIGWVGRLEENKNWIDFLSIGAKLIQINPAIELWIFEDNTLSTKEERLAFENKINELKLGSHLTIYANQPHKKMAEHFSIIGDSGGFLCSTSKVEGFGYAVLEAMVCKCPVLSTDSDGVRSFITHNVTGKFFPLSNVSQAVQEGKELLSNSQLRESIRKRAVEHIVKNFSPTKYANNFLNMIKTLENLRK